MGQYLMPFQNLSYCAIGIARSSTTDSVAYRSYFSPSRIALKKITKPVGGRGKSAFLPKVSVAQIPWLLTIQNFVGSASTICRRIFYCIINTVNRWFQRLLRLMTLPQRGQLLLGCAYLMTKPHYFLTLGCITERWLRKPTNCIKYS